MHDLLIRNGTVVDGTGGPVQQADIAILDGRIAAIGKDLGTSRETIDAAGMLVTPGFIDIHAHYDAQVLWDDRMEPSIWHGTTTAVMGNCGVGFAPALPRTHDLLIDLMAHVEDIPANVLAAALKWNWETFPEYLDLVDSKPRTIDVGSMLTMASLRSYVMGARAHEAATKDDIERMAEITREAMRAGALGLSVSRTILHADGAGNNPPGTHSTEAELTTLARAMRETGRGVLEVSPSGIAFPEPETISADADWLLRIAETTGCPVTFLLTQSHFAPDEYRAVLERCVAARRRGVPIYPQVNTRPTGNLLSFQADNHPFRKLPSFQPLLSLPHAERIARLRDPVLRARILSEHDEDPKGIDQLFADPSIWDSTYEMGNPLNYFPRDDTNIAKMAQRAGVDPRALAYDKLLENDGNAFLVYVVSNWAGQNDAALFEMMSSETSVLGLNDSGAHLTAVCDASQPITLLTTFVRDRDAADPRRMTIEAAVKKLTLDNAALFGLHDRGALQRGLRADINIIDLDALAYGMPMLVYDMPDNMPRLDQRAVGYEALIVNGQVVTRHGELTNARPGRVARC
jgi:N-acyl-D-amino-acid deacylase